MKIIPIYLSVLLLVIITGCSKDSGEYADGLFADASGKIDGSGSGTGEGSNDQSGLITAGEWNDLDNWAFWLDLMNGDDYADMPSYWNFYNEHRLSISIKNGNQAVVDADVELLKNGNAVWKCKSDNFGTAELWPHLFDHRASLDIEDYSLKINGMEIDQSLKLFSDGINEIELNGSSAFAKKLELCFIVDATGSMSDELEFLKDDLEDVIETVASENQDLEILTSSVFYRDIGDKYVVRSSDFTSKLKTTLNFIDDQSADGGGDFPEAVHSAMLEGIDKMEWSDNAKTRLLFLLLDAPPHYEEDVIEDIQKATSRAAQKGIKIIPITASGINKETEFLMRFLAISTNATYVFITNDSGIGNDHLEASVGEFEVEYLNELMVRLINKYAE